jgi:hypothetical protein
MSTGILRCSISEPAKTTLEFGRHAAANRLAEIRRSIWPSRVHPFETFQEADIPGATTRERIPLI